MGKRDLTVENLMDAAYTVREAEKKKVEMGELWPEPMKMRVSLRRDGRIISFHTVTILGGGYESAMLLKPIISPRTLRRLMKIQKLAMENLPK